MSGERSNGTERNEGSRLSSRRRQLLATLGAAAGTAALAGCTSGSSASSPSDTSAGMESDAIDRRFGYIGTTDDSPPVEPDHTVFLNIGPRENAEIPEFWFEPTGLAIEPGDTVRFNLATPHHNVNAYHPTFGYRQRVPNDAPAYSSPIQGPGEYWLYTFETEGVHNIMCAPHEVFGMVGTIVVGSATGPGANPVGDAPAPGEEFRSPPFTAATVFSDPAMSPENILEQGSVSWNDIADENKRLLLTPAEEE